MIAAVSGPLRGAAILFLLTLNTVFWCILFFPVALLKLWPHAGWRGRCTLLLRRLGGGWVAVTNAVTRRLPIRWDLEVPGGLRRDRSYTIVANHRSWADILVFLRAFGGRLPFPVFLVKKELLWLPFVGFAMWALEFPFIERYSRDVLARHPELRGRDLETARRACEKYRRLPVTLVIFPEGTRYTREKRHQQKSPFRHLLSPRPGGLAVVLEVLGDQLEALFDLTILYPPGRTGFWDFLCGRVPRVSVRVRRLETPADLGGDYQRDLGCRIRVRKWLEDLWREKDDLIEHNSSPESKVQSPESESDS